MGATGWFFPHQLDEIGYLVDSASSHMLISKIKPCMSKFRDCSGDSY